MLLSIAIAAIIASELWSAWKALKKPNSTISLVATGIITVITVIFIGYAMPWYRILNYGWWYALVTACSLHIGCVAWRIYTLDKEKSPNSPNSPSMTESLPNLRQNGLH